MWTVPIVSKIIAAAPRFANIWTLAVIDALLAVIIEGQVSFELSFDAVQRCGVGVGVLEDRSNSKFEVFFITNTRISIRFCGR